MHARTRPQPAAEPLAVCSSCPAWLAALREHTEAAAAAADVGGVVCEGGFA